MQSRFGVFALPQSRSCRRSWRWGAALAVVVIGLCWSVQAAFAVNERPGIKPQWTYQQFALNDRMTLSVNVESGNLNLAARDIDVGGNLGPQADFSRFYNSRVLLPSDLGAGWLTNAGPDVRLAINLPSAGWVTLYGPTGYQATFAPNGAAYKLATGIGAQLTKNGDGSYEVWMYRQAVKYEFPVPTLGISNLTATKDLSGNTLTNGYTSGALTSLTSQQGVTSTITEASGLITGASAPPSSAARTWGYARDANGNLHTYTGPDGLVTTYTYDAGLGHHLIQIDDPEARRTIIGYDASGKATSVKQVTNNATNAGDTTTFVYTPGTIIVGGVTYDGKTVETDANAHATTFYYEMNNGKVLRTDDPLGHIHYGAYTANDDLSKATDALANQTNFKYTDTGATDCSTTNDFLYRPCKTTSQLGLNSTQAYGDATNPFLPTTKVDSRGVTTGLAYDANVGLVNQATDARSKNTTFIHNPANGNLTKVTNPKAFDTNFTYFAANGALKQIDTDLTIGAYVAFAYDAAFRVTCTSFEGGQAQTGITYDNYDRSTNIDFLSNDCTPGSFAHTVRVFDKSGNETALTQYTSTGTITTSTTYSYDSKNRLTQEAQTAPFAATTTYTYDGADNLKTIVNAGGTTTYNYDAADRLTSIVEPGPNTTSFGYDNADRRTSTTYPNSVVETYTYDGDGNITRLVATKSTTTLLDLEYVYCSAYVSGPCISPNVPKAQRMFVRDRVSSHDAVDSTTQYTYNPNGWLTEANTTATVGGTPIKDYKWTYDDNGNRATQQIDGGTVQTITSSSTSDRVLTGGTGACDESINHIWQGADDRGSPNCTQWSYDSRDQLSVLQGSLGFDNVLYSGDDNNDVISIGSVNWTNDQLGVSRKISGATSYDYLRDLNGQHLGQRTGTTRYYYVIDALGTVLEVTDSTGAIVNDYTYDPWGLQRTSTGQTTHEIPFRYGGNQWMARGAVYHLGARYYDPRFGHFTQPDPVFMYDQPGMGSRYVYANNDPVSNTDPTGELSGGGCPPGLTGQARLNCIHNLEHPAPPYTKRFHQFCVLLGASTFAAGFKTPIPAPVKLLIAPCVINGIIDLFG